MDHPSCRVEAGEIYPQLNPPGFGVCYAAPPILEFDQAGNLVEPLGR